MIALYSSNYPKYIESISGETVFICGAGSNLDFIPSKVYYMQHIVCITYFFNNKFQFDEDNVSEACGSKKLFIPTSKNDLMKVMKLKRTDPNQTLWVWSDYRRINETFFWSDTAKAWWSHENEHQERFCQCYRLLALPLSIILIKETLRFK